MAMKSPLSLLAIAAATALALTACGDINDDGSAPGGGGNNIIPGGNNTPGGSGTAGQLTDAEKTAATDAHNAARANVTPPAKPSLGNLAWDETLAANATDYASKCIWGHSQNTGNAYPGNYGENLYMSTGAANVADAVAAWVDEKKWYDYNSHSCSSGETCGHYTQIVWRGAAAVGCGYADCTSIDDQVGNLGGVTSGRIVVCQYDDQQTDTKPY